jgi:hypothetical protein
MNRCDTCCWYSSDTNTDAYRVEWVRHLCARDSGCMSVRDEAPKDRPSPVGCCEHFEAK